MIKEQQITIKPFGELFTFRKGKKPPNLGEKSSERTIPYIDIKAFETNEIRQYCSDEKVVLCNEDDVLIVWDGSRSGLVGYGAKGALGSTLSKIENYGFDSRFVYYFLQSYFTLLNTNTRGVGIPHVEPNLLKNLEFPVVGMEQQQKIVAKIEELFSHIDAGIEGLKKSKALLKQYRQSVLKAAVTGELTKDWRAENANKIEPASQLLKRILKERQQRWEQQQLEQFQAKGKPPKNDKWKEKYKEPENVVIQDVPAIPNEWVYVRLDVLTEINGGLTVDSKRGIENTTELPYLRVANVQRGYLDLKQMKNIRIPSDRVNQLLLKEGDVLFTEGGDRDKLGRGWVWKNEIEKCSFQNHIFRARPVLSELNSEFISFFGNTFGQEYFIKQGKQTTNLASINKTKLSAFPVPLCSIREQQEIILILDEKLIAADRLMTELDTKLTQAQQQKQTILASAFKGELVKGVM